MLFQVYQSTVLWQNNIQRQSVIPKEAVHANRNATPYKKNYNNF